MKLYEIIEFLEDLAPLSLQEDYDNSGLLVGDRSMDVDGAIVCLDSTPEVIDEAIANKCNLVIAHHPVVFSGLSSFTGANYVERAVIEAIRNGIAVYAIHTNLDNVVANGVNEEITRRLGLTEVRPLRSGTEPDRGAGAIGYLEKQLTPSEMLAHIKDCMRTPLIRHTSLIDRTIEKVAVCGGSGSFLLGEAIAAGADFFVTADFKYHQFFDAEGQLVIADVGHYESEQFTVDLLGRLITENFPNFAVRFAETNTNPVNYYY